jgi:hypothetical protein
MHLPARPRRRHRYLLRPVRIRVQLKAQDVLVTQLFEHVVHQGAQIGRVLDEDISSAGRSRQRAQGQPLRKLCDMTMLTPYTVT